MDRGSAPDIPGYVVLTLRRIAALALLIHGSLHGALVSAHDAPGSVLAHRQVLSAPFVPVLIYHHVKPLKPSDDAIERGLTVLPSEFEAQLAYLQAHHFSVIPATRLVEALRSGRPLPRNPVVLTFDDGYRDMYSEAYPLLRKHHMLATFFLVPGFLDTQRYLSWTQVQTMASHRMDIEAHSMTHPDLTQVSPTQARGELVDSRLRLEQRLHRTVRIFAYPYGAYDNSVLAEVHRAGYIAAFTTRQGWRPDFAASLTLPRVYIDLDDTISIFAGRLRADPAVLSADPV